MADDNEGDLPIHYAARFNNGDACELLVKAKTVGYIRELCVPAPLTQAPRTIAES